MGLRLRGTRVPDVGVPGWTHFMEKLRNGSIMALKLMNPFQFVIFLTKGLLQKTDGGACKKIVFISRKFELQNCTANFKS